MSANLKRGLFRLWLVMSAAFIIWVGLANFQRLEGEFGHASADAAASDASEAAAEATYNVDAAAYAAALAAHVPGSKPSAEEAIGPPPKPKAPVSHADIYAPAWRDAGISVGLAFGTPLLVLMFGYGLWWAARGFAK